MNQLRCPDCDLELELLEHESVQLHGCGACGGVFVTHADLKQAAEDESAPRSDAERLNAAIAATARVRETVDAGVRRCPVCDRAMRRYVYAYSSGVLVDGCDLHGLWLDRGELERIEAWSEASRRDLTKQSSDPITAQTVTPPTEVAKPDRAGQATPQPLLRTGMFLVGGPIALVSTTDIANIGRSFAASREARANTSSSSSLSIVDALARAEADKVPDEDSGAVSQRAEAQLDVGVHVVWPLLARIDALASWMAGLDAATTVEGRGSRRVDELVYSNQYVVRQRVTRLVPDQELVWRVSAEWIRGVEVPAWNAGSWTALGVTRIGSDACRVSMAVTQLPADEEQLTRIQERAPALHAWVRDSLAQLAVVASAAT